MEIETIVVGAIATLAVSYVVEHLLTWHRLKIITLEKRSDEFIKHSEDCYIPLASVVASIKAETDLKYTVRPKILLFKVAKYLILYERFSDVGVTFPKYTQEYKITACADIFYNAINLLLFNDDREVIACLIKCYNEKPDIPSFVENIERLPKYSTFEEICNKEKIKKVLYDYSSEFSESILEGITEAYKAWYKFEFRKRHKEQNIDKDTDKKINIIRDIYNKL